MATFYIKNDVYIDETYEVEANNIIEAIEIYTHFDEPEVFNIETLTTVKGDMIPSYKYSKKACGEYHSEEIYPA